MQMVLDRLVYDVDMTARGASHCSSTRFRTFVCIFMLVITIASCFVIVGYGDGDSYEVRLVGGAIGVSWGDLPGWPSKHEYTCGFEWWTDGPYFLLLPDVGSWESWHWVYAPFWPVTVVLVLWTVIPRWRIRRRARQGLCLRCGYNLTGNVTQRCPECGEPVTYATDRDGEAVHGPDAT